jgi:probable HAF family extracellular repeat protein
MKRLVMAAGLLLVSGCFNDPTDTSVEAGTPRFAASSAGIQAVFLGGNPSRAYGINESGFTVGSVDGNGIAAVWTAPGTFSVVGPGLFSQFHDVNDQGVAVGYWAVAGGTIHAVRWTEAGGFEDIGTLRPGSYSYAQAVNNAGQIVGNDQQGGQRPFLWSPSSGMTALAILPGSINGIAFDINDAGAVVGESHAELDGINHGVLWPASGGVVDLGSLGGRFSTAHGINSSGQVVGWSMVATEELHAFIWTEATGMVDLNTWGSPCAGASQAEAISDEGVVVGACDGRPVIWTQSQGMRELGTPDGGSEGVAYDINSKGQVVGTFGYIGAALWIVEQPPVVDPGPVNIMRTVIWDGEANGINSDRAVVGRGSFPGMSGSDVLVWWPGLDTPHQLPLLPGDVGGVALAINDAWQIVGSSGSSTRRAVLWQPNSSRTDWTVHDLGVPQAASAGTDARAINNAGVVVGTAGSNGFVWVPGAANGSTGTVQRLCPALNALNCLGSSAYGINDRGRIAGTGTYSGSVVAFNDAAVTMTPPDWTTGVVLPYMDPADRQGNRVFGIDAAGNVVGSTALYDAVLFPSPGFTYRCLNRVMDPTVHFCAVAMLWPAGGGAPIDLGSLGGQYLNEASASALVGNASEIQVVGLSSDPTGHSFPFRWTQLTGMQRLPITGSSQQGRAYSLNNRGDIVGTYEDGSSRAVVWHATPLVSTQTPQAITFTSASPSPAQVGASYTVTATGGASGNPVVFTTPNAACSVDGSVVSLVAVGECRITANQDGNSGYTAAPAVDQTFDVVKGDQAITFTTSPPDPAFVGNSYTVAATGGGSGNPVLFTTGDVTCSVTGSTVTFVGSGSCRVLADQAGSADYNSAPRVAQTITIVKQAQAITFTSRPPTPALLDGNYTIAATGGGSGIAVTFSSLTPATCSVTGSSVGFIGVGTCVLAADQAGNAAYTSAPQQTQQLSVIYSFTGFFQPVDGANTVNVLKISKAVPIRFKLGGNRGLNVLQGTPVSTVAQCGNGPLDAIEETAPASQAGLQYDAAANQYVYVWPTDKAWALGCRRFTLTLNDGTTHSALFQLTK